MATVNPYLVFNGNCEAAFLFYESVFETKIPYMGKFGEMPESESKLTENEANLVMHVTLPIGKDTVLMGSDANAASGNVKFGDNVSVSINAESIAEADKLFYGLSESGIIKMPIQKTFWNAYFGMFTDKFGIHWMVNFDL